MEHFQCLAAAQSIELVRAAQTQNAELSWTTFRKQIILTLVKRRFGLHNRFISKIGNFPNQQASTLCLTRRAPTPSSPLASREIARAARPSGPTVRRYWPLGLWFDLIGSSEENSRPGGVESGGNRAVTRTRPGLLCRSYPFHSIVL